MFNRSQDKLTNNGVQNIMKALLDMPTGVHTILVYPDLMTIRELYTKIRFD